MKGLIIFYHFSVDKTHVGAINLVSSHVIPLLDVAKEMSSLTRLCNFDLALNDVSKFTTPL